MSEIFISYATSDRDMARALASLLEGRGHSSFWDRTILPGAKWDEVIEAALQRARVVVVLWSKAAVRSDWVKNEAGHAADRGVLVPVLIERVEPPLRFRSIQAADLSKWDGTSTSSEVENLLRSIEDRVERKQQTGGDHQSLAEGSHQGGHSADGTDVIRSKVSRRQALAIGVGALGAVGILPLAKAVLTRLLRDPAAPSNSSTNPPNWVKSPRYVHRKPTTPVSRPVGAEVVTVEQRAITLANARSSKDALELLLSEINRDLARKQREKPPRAPSFRLWDLCAAVIVQSGLNDYLPQLLTIGDNALPSHASEQRVHRALMDRVQKWSLVDSKWRRKWATLGGHRSWSGLLM